MKRRLDDDKFLQALLSDKGVFVHQMDGSTVYLREDRIVETEVVKATRIRLRNPSEQRVVSESPEEINAKLGKK